MGALQFYDMASKRVTSTLDVSFKNYASKTFGEEAHPLRISHVAFSPAGNSMLTVEQAPAVGLSRLKFWRRNGTAPFILAALIEAPHHGKRITQVCTLGDLKSAPAFITAGEDGKFMLWELAPGTMESEAWTCSVVGGYKDMAIRKVRVGRDPATGVERLAVLHEKNVVTLWTAGGRELKQVICAALKDEKEEIMKCEFSTNGQYMVGITQSTVCSYNLQKRTLLWELRLAATDVINDPSADSQCCLVVNPTAVPHKEDESPVSSSVLIVNYEASAPLTIFKFKGGLSILGAVYADLKYKRNSVAVFKSNGQIQKISYLNETELAESRARALTKGSVKEIDDGAVYGEESRRLSVVQRKPEYCDF